MRPSIRLSPTLLSLLLAASISPGGAQSFFPPPEPAIRPIIAVPQDALTPGTRVDRRLYDVYADALSVLSKRNVADSELSAAQTALVEPVQIEFVFDRQITQQQLDTFLSSGGQIDRVMQSVSYGWTGSISRAAAVELSEQMGSSLVAVVEGVPTELYLDHATRTGRVRPQVWDLGFAGSSTTTIAILDSGVDGTHTDLAGRQEYWKDWTSDNLATASDMGHHGSHVAGIATGTGASAGASPSTITFSVLGNMASTIGSFSPSTFYLPTSVSAVNFTTNMRWATASGGDGSVGGCGIRHNRCLGAVPRSDIGHDDAAQQHNQWFR
jgi:subtilisin family serine protease